MFVKWERQGRDIKGKGRDHRLDAFLVCRRKGGNGMEETILEYLGSIEERFLKCKELGVRAFHQGIFWAKLDKRLDELSLESVGRRRIVEQILETVPRPDGDWPLWCVRCIPQYER